MSKWEHLFVDGEFISRPHLLRDLTLEQAAMRPPGLSHSIYEELWHTAKWQSIVVRRDEAAAAAWNEEGPQFPTETPHNQQMWTDLVTEFLEGAATAAALGSTPGARVEEARPGVTLADRLQSLAVHNAYHLGKIVALRQMIGAWPPPKEGEHEQPV